MKHYILTFFDGSGVETHKEWRLIDPLKLATELIQRWEYLEFSQVYIRMGNVNHYGKNHYTFPESDSYDRNVSAAYNDFVLHLSDRRDRL